jgi:hypothetical protein
MASQLNKLEMTSLYWVSMDYETLETIVGNVSNDYGKIITKELLHKVLVGLRLKGLVESYMYSPANEKYVPQAPVGEYPQKDLWWFTTKKGEQELKNNL